MTNTHTYCPECRKHIPEADIRWGYYLPQQKYGDNAHPAEYDEPCCPDCGSDLTEGEECELCEEVFEPEKIKNGLCIECRAFALIQALVFSEKPTIINQIIDEYGVGNDDANEIFKAQLRAYAE